MSMEEKRAKVARLQEIERKRALVAQLQAQEKGEEFKPLDIAETAGRSGLQGLTLGLSEPVFSGINALAATGLREIQSRDEADIPFLDTLKEEYAKDVARRKQLQIENPLTDVGSQLAGSLVSLAIPGSLPTNAGKLTSGLKALDVGGGVGRAVRVGSDAIQGTIKGSRIAQAVGEIPVLGKAANFTGRIAGATGEGAVQGLAALGTEHAVLRSSGFRKKGEGPDFGDAAELGAGIGGGLKLGGEVLSGARKLTPKVMSVLFGPKEESIQELYDLKRAGGEIDSAWDVKTWKKHLDDKVSSLRSAVDKGELSVEEAGNALDNMRMVAEDEAKIPREKLNALWEDASENLKQQIFDKRMQVGSARDAKATAEEAALAPFKSLRAPTDMAGEVLEATRDLKRQVVEGSEQAYKILEHSKGTINLNREVTPRLTAAQNALKVGGKLTTPIAEEAFSKLEKLKSGLKGTGEAISLPEAKRYIQQLDQLVEWASREGGFDKSASKAIKEVRRAIDVVLKDVPGYSEVMAEVAKKADKLTDISQMMGDLDRARVVLGRVGKDSAVKEREALKYLSEVTGRDLFTPVEEFYSAQAFLKNPRQVQELTQGLPEARALSRAEAELNQLQNPQTRTNLRASIESSPIGQQALSNEAYLSMIKNPESIRQAERLRLVEEDKVSKLNAARQRLADAEQDLVVANKALEPFKGITAESSQGFAEAILKGKNIEKENVFAKLAEISDEDLIAMAERSRLARAFEGGYSSGSRNVNLWKGIMDGMMATIGYGAAGTAALGPLGTLIGVGFGAVVDRKGPQIAKALIEKTAQIRGIPTIDKVATAFSDMPASVRNEMLDGFIRSVSQLLPENTKYTDLEIPMIKQDIQSSKLSNIEKARAINSLSKSKELSGETLRKIQIGDAVIPKDPVQHPIHGPSPAVILDSFRKKQLQSL